MVQPEIGFRVETDDCTDEHEEQHLESFSGADETPEEIIPQLDHGKHHHHTNRYQHQVIIVIDLECCRKLVRQRQPDLIEHTKIVIQVVEHSEKEENGNEANQTRYPFSPAEGTV